MTDTRPRWLVTGAGGMLGQDVLAHLVASGDDAIGLDRRSLDITDPARVRAAVRQHRPDIIVNCAAWTAVDDAEERELEALRINGDGARNLAEACARAGASMLHVSTDYVFAGTATIPYGEDDPTDPVNAYGRTKLAGERAVRATLPDTGYVVRTAWLYGAGGPNFVRTMIALERTKDTIDVVDDQRGQPTWTGDLAAHLARLGRAAVTGAAPAGVYHGTSSGEGTWFDLARETFRLVGADPARVRPTTSAAYVRAAARPAFSVLGHAGWHRAGMTPIRDWRAALADAVPVLATEVPR
ncbi:MAG TPA: dTDP-4-dehydrorhamnose reductase [Micromonosporaceae bacterium]|nr:dTDP-4-dehydrorhamnose reductase [Micromonosporaceae bacterium]